jgi:hypothetical protein
VHFVPSLPTNLFPLKRLQEIATSAVMHVGKNANRGVELTLPSGVVLSGNYEDDILVLSSPTAFIATVKGNEARFDRREVVRAKKAREVQEILGFPSTPDLVAAVRHGIILDMDVTTQDIARSEAIYGPSVSAIMGRATDHKARSIIQVNGVKEVSPQTMYSDVFVIDGASFLASVAKPLDLIIVTDVSDSRKYDASELSRAVNEACDVLTGHGFTIESMHFDGQGEQVKTKPRVTITGAGDHVSVAERAIRTIEERVTALRVSLPFKVSRTLGKHLVRYAVTVLNLFPSLNDYDKRSPRERMTGIKPSLKSFRNLSFGDYCHVLARISPAQRRATTHSRTVGAIAVCPTFNTKGSWMFVSLETGCIIRRTWCKRLPIPQDVIQLINSFSGVSTPESTSFELPSINSMPPALRGGTFSNRFSDLEIDDEAVDSPVEDSAADPANAPHAANVITPRPPGALPDVGVASQLEPSSGVATPFELSASSEQGMSIPNNSVNAIASVTDLITNDTISDQMSQSDSVFESGLRKSERLMAKRLRALHASLKSSLLSFGEAGRQAALVEIRQMLNKGVFHMIDPYASVRTIPSQLFLKQKRDANGVNTKVKGRLVAGGHKQLRDISDDVSSPTVSTEALLLVAAVSAAKGHRIATVDVEAAFLECDIDSEIHMRLPPEICAIMVSEDASLSKYQRKDGSIVVKLAKALYGTIQASSLWYEKLSGVLLANGFRANNYDRCVFYKSHNGENIMLTIHVDDVFMSSTTDAGIKYVVSFLSKSFTSISCNYDPVVEYLGMRFERSESGISVTMPGYVDDCVKLFCAQDSIGKSSSPADSNLFEVDESSPPLSTQRSEALHSIVAKVLYLGTRVRPDLLPVISFLSSRVSKSTDADWTKLRRMMSYLSATARYGLFYRYGGEVKLSAYVDASHGTHTCDGTGRTGIVITLAGNAICCKSSRQKIVTLSSTEAELVALIEGSNNVMWLRNLMSDLNLKDYGPTILYEDNTSTIGLVVNEKTRQQRTRHLNCKYFAIRERIRDNCIVLKHLPGKEMPADILTKGVDVSTLKRLLPCMMHVVN